MGFLPSSVLKFRTYFESGFKFSQLEISWYLIHTSQWNRWPFLLELILAILLEKIEFSLSDKDIVWRMTAIATPYVDMDSTIPSLPMRLSLVNSKVWLTTSQTCPYNLVTANTQLLIFFVCRLISEIMQQWEESMTPNQLYLSPYQYVKPRDQCRRSLSLSSDWLLVSKF